MAARHLLARMPLQAHKQTPCRGPVGGLAAGALSRNLVQKLAVPPLGVPVVGVWRRVE
jgi:hypothetical protein